MTRGLHCDIQKGVLDLIVESRDLHRLCEVSVVELPVNFTLDVNHLKAWIRAPTRARVLRIYVMHAALLTIVLRLRAFAQVVVVRTPHFSHLA